MKNLTYTIGLVALLFGQAAQANTIILPSLTAEPSLIGGILDSEFGLANLQRVDDNSDQYWNAAKQIEVTAIAKHASFKQIFGFISANDNFIPILDVPSMAGQNTVIPGPIAPFRFGLDPSGSPVFSSDPSDNPMMADHMVSWLITGGTYKGDYVLAWEDLTLLGDIDYNDLVVRVSGVSNIPAVPVPTAVWLFGSGLIALATISRRRPV
jgi:hypothetical protein